MDPVVDPQLRALAGRGHGRRTKPASATRIRRARRDHVRRLRATLRPTSRDSVCLTRRRCRVRSRSELAPPALARQTPVCRRMHPKLTSPPPKFDVEGRTGDAAWLGTRQGCSLHWPRCLYVSADRQHRHFGAAGGIVDFSRGSVDTGLYRYLTSTSISHFVRRCTRTPGGLDAGRPLRRPSGQPSRGGGSQRTGERAGRAGQDAQLHGGLRQPLL